MKRQKIKWLLEKAEPGTNVIVKGWLRTRRDSKEVSFLAVNDGSCQKNLQVISSSNYLDEKLKQELTTGCSLTVRGKLVQSLGKEQRVELSAEEIIVTGLSDAQTYPLQKKGHTFEFLRTIPHLRARTNIQGAIYRIRSHASFAVHKFFQSRGFFFLHAPIITGSDCEGAGAMFKVTTLPLENGVIDFDKDFFGKQASLTVSGQLQAETSALALSDVYTFGPTFRAENSNTPRHLAEFWMIEPEMSFYDLNDNMDLAEDFLKYLIGYILDNCEEDLNFLNQWVDKSLLSTLSHVKIEPFERISYTEAIELLQKSGKDFEYPVAWGLDLQSEHERYLTEDLLKKPLIVYNYPKDIKSFYMRLNDDGKTVAAMDVLIPRIGEIIGGSQREERLDRLTKRMEELGIETSLYEWYIDLRRFGTAEHSGFGMGFERLMMFLTGMTNIRDVIPFPRTPRNLDT